MLYLNVNNAGDCPENPLVEGMAYRIYLHKHGTSAAIRKCWVSHDQASSEDATELTTSVVVNEQEAYVDVLVGDELKVGTPPRLNVIHWTTDDSVHEKRAVYCAGHPPHEVLLDGYDAQDPMKPYVVHRFL